MKNGYFRLVSMNEGFGVRLIPPTEDGMDLTVQEVTDYLSANNLLCNVKSIQAAIEEKKEEVIFIGEESCPAIDEKCNIRINEEGMLVTARFYAPSETGKRLDLNEFIKDLKFRKISSGIQMGILQEHFQEGCFCEDLKVAVGRPPRHGSDAKIEYHFNTDVHASPALQEDGSVDFYHLNIINHCKKGEVLAHMIPEDMGEYGLNVYGTRIKPRDVKRTSFKYGRNIEVSEDKLSLITMVDGHVMLVEGKVFVSDVFEVENVDLGTGNIEFQGSVKVNGNVQSNMTIKVNGNVIVDGIVEGATIIAGGDIIIARGMNGMTKGVLQAGGNIIAKFLENATVNAEGYIATESILHCKVMAGTEIEVTGKRGFITGGYVCAANRITVKTLGATLGNTTIIEVGVNPQIKARYIALQKEMVEIQKVIRNAQPIIAGFAEKRAKGARITEEQFNYVKSVAQNCEAKKAEFAEKNEEWEMLQEKVNGSNRACVEVTGEVFPGTTIVIGDVSKVIQSSYKYCRFEKVNGDVTLLSL